MFCLPARDRSRIGDSEQARLIKSEERGLRGDRPTCVGKRRKWEKKKRRTGGGEGENEVPGRKFGKRAYKKTIFLKKRNPVKTSERVVDN